MLSELTGGEDTWRCSLLDTNLDCGLFYTQRLFEFTDAGEPMRLKALLHDLKASFTARSGAKSVNALQ